MIFLYIILISIAILKVTSQHFYLLFTQSWLLNKFLCSQDKLSTSDSKTILKHQGASLFRNILRPKKKKNQHLKKELVIPPLILWMRTRKPEDKLTAVSARAETQVGLLQGIHCRSGHSDHHYPPPNMDSRSLILHFYFPLEGP